MARWPSTDGLVGEPEAGAGETQRAMHPVVVRGVGDLGQQDFARPAVGCASLVSIARESATLGPLHAESPEQVNPIVGDYDWHNGKIMVIRENGSATPGENQGGPLGGQPLWRFRLRDHVGGRIRRKFEAQSEWNQIGGMGFHPEGRSYRVWGTKRK
jgi:hypothetical protein